MDFSDKELRVLLQALYRFRGEVSGQSQSEQNRLGVVNSVIDKIEDRVGPIKAELTSFDRQMAESLSVLDSGKTGGRRSKAAEAEAAEGKAPKVETSPPKKRASAAKPAAKKPATAKETKAKASPSASGKSRTKG